MLFRSGLYNRILLIERPKYKPKDPKELALQRKGFRLVPVRHHELTPEEMLRISQLEITPGVEGDEAQPPSADQKKKAP